MYDFVSQAIISYAKGTMFTPFRHLFLRMFMNKITQFQIIFTKNKFEDAII